MATPKISLGILLGLLIAASGGGTALGAPAGSVATSPRATDSPVWLEQAILASDIAEDGYLGWSIALDGTIALIGSPQCGCIGAPGKAYLFTKSGGAWTQVQKITSSDGASDDQFGWSVALDGTTAVLGAELADVNGNKDQGAAYVFTESGGHWTQ
ncbi:MAG: FG-GAP repeat protein, partial [Gammaproteobacteria bacterium]